MIGPKELTMLAMIYTAQIEPKRSLSGTAEGGGDEAADEMGDAAIGTIQLLLVGVGGCFAR